MAKRGENIHKRKDGRWEGRIIIDRDTTGKAIYKSIYGKSYSEVKQKLVNKIKKQELTNDLNTESYREYLFKDVLILWLKNNRIKFKGATENKYQYLIDTHIIPALGDIKLSKISAITVNNFLENKLLNGRIDKNGGLSNSYVKTMMQIITSTLNFAAEENMCKPLSSRIIKPKTEIRSIKILTPYEQKKLEQELIIDMDCTKLGILISLYAGLRIGEICALKWENIDLNNQVICIRSTIARVLDDSKKSILIIDKPKTKSSTRDIPIASLLLPYLYEMNKKRSSDFVVSDRSDFISPRTYEYRYHKILKKSGLPPINYHALRHSFATRCIEVGVDVKSLSEMLGHSNVSITLNTYVHSSMDLKRSQIEKLSTLSA